ncbi:MAG: DUF1080 domain-containing protein [bacterium]
MNRFMFSSIKQYMFTQLLLLILFAFTTPLTSYSTPSATLKQDDIIGRWDLTVSRGDKLTPSWLEVKLSGVKTLVGFFVADGGSARPISRVNFKEGKVSFSIPPQWESSENDMVFEGILENDKLTGIITASDGKRYTFTGARAPLLKRTKPVVWGTPIKLFNGKDLAGWHADGEDNQWEVKNGNLTSARPGSNIVSDKKFDDFKLHIEFRYPAHSNSGVYLRGRYEIQVEDNQGLEPASVLFGGIYGFITPNEMAAKSPGEWQSYDVTLIGRRVTVVANGKKIICDQIIPGITGGALDSNEGEPGPIMLQGDHGLIEYRNIIITPAK